MQVIISRKSFHPFENSTIRPFSEIPIISAWSKISLSVFKNTTFAQTLSFFPGYMRQSQVLSEICL